jgi:hypothetical protein
MMRLEPDISIIKELRIEADKSPCKVIKFSASDGRGSYSYNGEFYANCENCKRTDIEQPYPDCKANHAEWGILSKRNKNSTEHNLQNCSIYIYCKTPDGKDYPFIRFWCRTCSILLPMFGIKDVYMWDGNKWTFRDSSELISEVESKIDIKVGEI